MPERLVGRSNVMFIPRLEVWWAGWSHQQAILNLLKAATERGFDYYALLSGSDYPIRPLSFFYKTLEQGGEYINIIKGFQSHKPEERVRYYYYDCFDRRNKRSVKRLFFRVLEELQKPFFQKKEYPFPQIYHGTTWYTLSHACVSYVLQFLEHHPEYISFYKSSWCPDESLIHTIIGNSTFITSCKGCLTYSDWSDNGPVIINNKHVDLLEKQHCFESLYGSCTPCFARKFNDHSEAEIEQIDCRLRSE